MVGNPIVLLGECITISQVIMEYQFISEIMMCMLCIIPNILINREAWNLGHFRYMCTVSINASKILP